MRRRRKKRKIKLRHIMLMLIIFGICKTLIDQSLMLKELNERKRLEEEAITQLEKEIDELNEEIENKDSLSFIEKTAREDLKMVKPREIIYIDRGKDKGLFKFFNR